METTESMSVFIPNKTGVCAQLQRFNNSQKIADFIGLSVILVVLLMVFTRPMGFFSDGAQYDWSFTMG